MPCKKNYIESRKGNNMPYTPDPTKEEIDALIREVEKSRRRHRERIKFAVNPKYDYGQ